MLTALQHHHTVHCCGSSSTRPVTTRSCIAAAHQPRQQQRRQPVAANQQQQHKPASHRPHNKSRQRPQTSAFADSIKATQQLNDLQRLLAEHIHKLTPHELVAVFLRAAKLRPLPRPWQQEQLLQPTWTALRDQLAACKVSRRHPAKTTLQPDSLPDRSSATGGPCELQIPALAQILAVTQIPALAQIPALTLSAVQAYEVVMVMWAASKLGYRDPGACAASCLQVLTHASPSARAELPLAHLACLLLAGIHLWCCCSVGCRCLQQHTRPLAGANSPQQPAAPVPVQHGVCTGISTSSSTAAARGAGSACSADCTAAAGQTGCLQCTGV